ncbi:DUF998 domain-containing protein [Dactylosporangium sp. CA-233914]|uniref:DUF998 domain-containing protein n=1 Tax=Dactylosporangium sp. CA-233914 TaxID=3239934 RepID=UPI003D944705
MVEIISDLGNVTCGPFDGRDICSPAHRVFNIGAILLGCLVAAGAVLVRDAWGNGKPAVLGRLGVLLAALGYVLVGAFPADVNLGMHLLAALFVMPVANIGLLASGLTRRGSTLWEVRWITRTCGIVAFVASYLHFFGPWLGIGKGGMERVAVFTLIVWCGGIGIFLLRRIRLGGGRRAGTAGASAEEPDLRVAG